jgi:hypothetical protein
MEIDWPLPFLPVPGLHSGGEQDPGYAVGAWKRNSAVSIAS